MKAFIISLLTFLGLYSPVTPSALIVSPSPIPPVSTLPTMVPLQKSDFTPPTADFFSRITKKPFGIFITPNSSPVKPEKFTGFHTGADAEYEDVSMEVPVVSVYSGKIVYSGFVQGYGGVIVQSLRFQNQDYLVLYGHLSPSSLVKTGTQVSAGQKLGILGTGYSQETDGERRHLHLAIINGSKLNLKGYVASKSSLSSWQNPVDFLNSR